ncbi:transketolase [Luteimonas sp. A277]
MAPDKASASLDQRCIDTLRFLCVDMVEKADSGHPGLPLGAAPMAYVLWQHFLKHNPANPLWTDRDRFVLSAGHGSALLYSLLHVTGYDLTLDEIKQFRQWGSKAPGHPERGHTPGVEVTTGPLGQGFANAVGMAMAEAQLAARYNRAGHVVVDHRTWVIASDGDLMEGVSSEAASLAGHLKLGKLNVLYDDNSVTLAAGTDITFTEDCAARFAAYDWHVETVDDGNDVAAIERALQRAHDEITRPSLVLVRTHIGFGSPEQDSYKAHGSPLGEEGVAATKCKLGWPEQPAFLLPDDAMAQYRSALDRGKREEDAWQQRFDAYAEAFADEARELRTSLEAKLPEGWDADIPVFTADAKGMATREAGGKVLSAIAPKLPALTGGSADLDPSTYTAVKGLGDFDPRATPGEDEQGSTGGGWSYAGRNLHFGVREHAMGAICNGMAAHGGIIPYDATFLIFSDYMRPPMRLAALMRLHVVHVFTHDSIALGEDGPTHQPVEQLAGLRSVPGLLVIRPADANETAVAWRVAIEARDRPVALALSRQKVSTLDRDKYASADGLRKGAYVLLDAEGGKPDVIVIGTGAETGLALAAVEKLQDEGIAARAVSMPCWELFDEQPQEFRESVLPSSVPARLAVEAGSPQGWHRYVGDHGDVLGVDRFGASAPGSEMLERYGFTVENVCARARALLGTEAS